MPNMKVVLSMVLKLDLPLGAAALRSAEGINPQSRFNGATLGLFVLNLLKYKQTKKPTIFVFS